MGILEFVVVRHITGKYLWTPANALARQICDLANRKNLTKEQIDQCRNLGFEIKVEVLGI